MKTSLLKAVAALTAMFALTQTSFAGKEGGAFDWSISKIDDSVRIADPFAINIEGDPLKYDILFSDEVKAEIKRIEWLLKGLDYNLGGSLRRLITENVTNPSLRYYVVSKLPDLEECKYPVSYPWLPANSRVERGACTIGNETWLVGAPFQKAILRHQGVALIHEGMRRLIPELSDRTIFRITRGLLVALDHLNRQNMGTRDSLSVEEASSYLAGVMALYTLPYYGISDARDPGNVARFRDYTVYKKGGALVHASLDFEKSKPYLGMGTVLTKMPNIGRNVTLIRVDGCDSKCSVGENSTLIGVELNPLSLRNVIGQNVTMTDTKILASQVSVGDGATLTNTEIRGYVNLHYTSMYSDVVIRADAKMHTVNLDLSSRTYSYNVNFEMGAGSTLLNVPNAKLLDYKNKNAWIQVTPGAVVDFGDRMICANSSNQFEFILKQKVYLLDSVAAFKAHCARN